MGIYAVGLGLVAVLLFVLRQVRLKRLGPQKDADRERESARLERERAQVVRQLVSDGTHIQLPNGSLVEKCVLCDQRAVHPPVRFERSLNLWAWMRERLGAPRRLRVGRAGFEAPTLCDTHVHLVREHFHAKLTELELAHAARQRDDELELQAFEGGGALRELREMTQQEPRRRGRKKEGKLLQLKRAQEG